MKNIHFVITKETSPEKAVLSANGAIHELRDEHLAKLVGVVGTDGSIMNGPGVPDYKTAYRDLTSFSAINNYMSAVMRRYKSDTVLLEAVTKKIKDGDFNVQSASWFTSASHWLANVAALARRNGNCEFDAVRDVFMPWKLNHVGVSNTVLTGARGCHYAVVLLVETEDAT